MPYVVTPAMTGMSGMSGSDPLAAYYHYDTFTDDDGVPLTSHTPEKGDPYTSTGVFEIQGNKATFLSLAALRNFAFATAPVPTANGYMQADLTIVGNGDIGIIINVQDVDHLWMAWYSNNQVYLYEQTAKEAFTNRGSFSTVPTTLKAVANGDTIEVWCDGVLRITYTVANRPYKTNAVLGLMQFGTPSSGSSFNNIKAGP